MVSRTLRNGLRRLSAALLIVAFAVPLPAVAALAGGGCTMDAPMLAAERCDCCTSPMAATTGGCGSSALGQAGCGCSIRPENNRQPVTVALDSSPAFHFAVESTRLAADLSTPRRTLRSVAMAASPPGAGTAVSRSRICSWTI